VGVNNTTISVDITAAFCYSFPKLFTAELSVKSVVTAMFKEEPRILQFLWLC